VNKRKFRDKLMKGEGEMMTEIKREAGMSGCWTEIRKS
jgi:hypothetical protein